MAGATGKPRPAGRRVAAPSAVTKIASFPATGLTFYDDEVVQFFEPHAAGTDAIFVTALGAATRRPAGRGLPVAPASLEPLRPGDA